MHAFIAQPIHKARSERAGRRVSAPRKASPPRAARRLCRARPRPAARIVTLAIALAVLALMVSGEHWMLEHPASAANELIVATCVVDAVFGDAKPADTVCTATRESIDKQGKL